MKIGVIYISVKSNSELQTEKTTFSSSEPYCCGGVVCPWLKRFIPKPLFTNAAACSRQTDTETLRRTVEGPHFLFKGPQCCGQRAGPPVHSIKSI